MTAAAGRARVTARAHPSLALTKYWGKAPGDVNLPATSSLALTLGELTTETVCELTDAAVDTVTVGGRPAGAARYAEFFDAVRRYVERSTGRRLHAAFAAHSTNTFPTSAGLASSASGFAALTTACVRAAGAATEDRQALSALARVGSGSAARSIYGGITAWEAGRRTAREVFPADWWPELRVVALPLSAGRKTISSREAMNLSRETSPMYPAWVDDAPKLFGAALEAVRQRDLEKLGEIARRSYLRMFATMLAADPPILYWLPSSVVVLQRLTELRAAGAPVWETMDAGPQVKVLTTAEYAPRVVEEFAELCARPPIASGLGEGAATVGVVSET